MSEGEQKLAKIRVLLDVLETDLQGIKRILRGSKP